MFDQLMRTWANLNRQWFGLLFGAMLLPGVLLIMASTEQGSPSVTAVSSPVLFGIVIVGGLLGAGLGLWAMTKQKQATTSMQAWVDEQPDQTRPQQILSLIGGLVFMAGGYQVVSDFDVFSRLIREQNLLGGFRLTSWETLLILCAIQFIFFFAQANLARRN